MRFRSCILAVLAGAISLAVLAGAISATAYADSYIQSASLPLNYLQGPSEQGIALQLFNPSLGTLTSVTQTLTGTLSFETKAGAPVSDYVIETGPILGPVTEDASTVLDASATATGSMLREFVAPSSVPSYLDVPFDITSNGGYLSSPELTDSFTFNYTPAAATPEPSSFLLLGTGLLGWAEMLRRRGRG